MAMLDTQWDNTRRRPRTCQRRRNSYYPSLLSMQLYALVLLVLFCDIGVTMQNCPQQWTAQSVLSMNKDDSQPPTTSLDVHFNDITNVTLSFVASLSRIDASQTTICFWSGDVLVPTTSVGIDFLNDTHSLVVGYYTDEGSEKTLLSPMDMNVVGAAVMMSSNDASNVVSQEHIAALGAKRFSLRTECAALLHDIDETAIRPGTVHLITSYSPVFYNYVRLLSSAVHFKWHFIQRETDPAFSLANKLFIINDIISQLDDDDVAIWADAVDVVVGRSPLHALTTFLRMRVPMLMSAERNPFHCELPLCDPSRYPPVTPRAAPYRFLNSGLQIGYVWAIRAALSVAMEIIDPAPKPCDQTIMHAAYYQTHHGLLDNPSQALERGDGGYVGADFRTNMVDMDTFTTIFGTTTTGAAPLFALDHCGHIFHNIYLSDHDVEFNVTSGVIENYMTGTKPSFLHGNGNGKWRLGHFAAMLLPALDPVFVDVDEYQIVGGGTVVSMGVMLEVNASPFSDHDDWVHDDCYVILEDVSHKANTPGQTLETGTKPNGGEHGEDGEQLNSIELARRPCSDVATLQKHPRGDAGFVNVWQKGIARFEPESCLECLSGWWNVTASVITAKGGRVAHTTFALRAN